jgi:hypothetical protein
MVCNYRDPVVTAPQTVEWLELLLDGSVTLLDVGPPV